MSKNVDLKNLLKTCFKLVLDQVFRVATFWATFGKRLATFVSTFLAALMNGKQRTVNIKKIYFLLRKFIYSFIHLFIRMSLLLLFN